MDLAALAVFHAVTVLLEKCTYKDLQVFDVFSEYISLLVGLPELSVVMPEILSSVRLSTKRDHLKSSEIVNYSKTQAKIRNRFVRLFGIFTIEMILLLYWSFAI